MAFKCNSIARVSCSAPPLLATTSSTMLRLTPAKRRTCDDELDLQTIMHLFESHRAQSAQCCDKDTVFVVGNTGAGKSTLVNYLGGSKIVTVRNADNQFVGQLEVEDPLDGCIVGHTANSETRYLRSYVDRDGGNLLLCDTPGFEDTDGSNTDIANAVAISWAIRKSKTVRLVLIIESSTIGNGRGNDLCRLLTLFKRFLIDVEGNLDSVVPFFYLLIYFSYVFLLQVLPLITRCEDTSPAKLLAALDRFITASHFRDTRSILQRIIDLLRSQPDVVMLRPADERGAELQPHVKALVYSLKPIANPRDVLRSPLSEISLSELILRCQTMATSMESRFRLGEPMRALKDDLDNLRMLSDALDLPDVTQSYHGVCSLLVEHVLGACQLARQNFVSGNYSETRHNFHRIDGFESMQEHCAVVDPDIRSREYVVVLMAAAIKRYSRSTHRPASRKTFWIRCMV